MIPSIQLIRNVELIFWTQMINRVTYLNTNMIRNVRTHDSFHPISYERRTHLLGVNDQMGCLFKYTHDAGR